MKSIIWWDDEKEIKIFLIICCVLTAAGWIGDSFFGLFAGPPTVLSNIGMVVFVIASVFAFLAAIGASIVIAAWLISKARNKLIGLAKK